MEQKYCDMKNTLFLLLVMFFLLNPLNAQREVFKVVEQMPRFPGCEDLPNNERKACASEGLFRFIGKNLKYPPEARENGVTGKCIVQFTVGKKGRLEDIKLVRDIGAGCGEAALNVVKMMNDMPDPWIPGRQRGRAVKVKYTLPITFGMPKGK